VRGSVAVKREGTFRRIGHPAAALAVLAVLTGCGGDDPASHTSSNDTKAAEPTARVTPTRECRTPPGHGTLAPGCWSIRVRGLPRSPRAELDLPEGFQGNDAYVWVQPDDGDWQGYIALWSAGDVYPNPCSRTGRPPRLDPSVDNFAAALAAQKVSTTTTPVPVSIDDHDGLYLELSTPPGFDFGKCREQNLVFWEGVAEESAVVEEDLTEPYRLWVLDVNGYLVVLGVYLSDTATTHSAELFPAIAESTTFALNQRQDR
jgi:hypothetical protein